MADSGETIRGYIEGDAEHISRLFQEVFGIGKSMDRLAWQFMDHVQGEGWMRLAEAGGEIVAQFCTMRRNLNFLGSEIHGGICVDAMVREDQRRKGLFTKLAEKNFSLALEDGVRAVIGFPNRESYPILIRRLNWHNITNLKRYYYRIGYKKIIGSAVDSITKRPRSLPARARRLMLRRLYHAWLHGRRAETCVTDSLPEGLGTALERAMRQEVISTWKDLHYLRWRYERHPDHDYEFHVLSIDGEPVGTAVCRRIDDIVAICELIHADKDIQQSSLLLLHVLCHYFRSEAQTLEFYGHDSGFFDQVFKSCGFRRVSTSRFVLAGRTFGSERFDSMFPLPHNWTVSYGDIDII